MTSMVLVTCMVHFDKEKGYTFVADTSEGVNVCTCTHTCLCIFYLTGVSFVSLRIFFCVRDQ